MALASPLRYAVELDWVLLVAVTVSDISRLGQKWTHSQWSIRSCWPAVSQKYTEVVLPYAKYTESAGNSKLLTCREPKPSIISPSQRGINSTARSMFIYIGKLRTKPAGNSTRSFNIHIGVWGLGKLRNTQGCLQCPEEIRGCLMRWLKFRRC